MTAYTKIRDQIEQHLDAAKNLARKAEDANRDFTPAEQEEVERHVEAAKILAPEARMLRADEKMTAKLRALGPDVDASRLSSGSGSGGTGYTTTGTSSWASTVAARLTKTASSFGIKALTTGGLDIPAPIEQTVTLPSRPARLLDIVPTRELVSNEYSFARQTARIPNVATVPDGQQKPQSTYTFEQIIDRARTVAHIGEPIPNRLFEDHRDIESILDDQMRVDLLLKVEALIAAGTGAGEDWYGILGTSGVLAQVWVSDLVTTLRKSRTALSVLGEQPTALVLNPVDIERLDLLTDGNSRYLGTEINSLLGDLPRIPSLSVPAGVGVLGDFRQSRLFIRQQAVLDVDAGGELFEKNLCRLRCEMRAGFGVLRPQAFVVVDLTP